MVNRIAKRDDFAKEIFVCALIAIARYNWVNILDDGRLGG